MMNRATSLLVGVVALFSINISNLHAEYWSYSTQPCGAINPWNTLKFNTAQSAVNNIKSTCPSPAYYGDAYQENGAWYYSYAYAPYKFQLYYYGSDLCPSPMVWDNQLQTCQQPIACPSEGTQIKTADTWENWQAGITPSSMTYQGCEYIEGLEASEDVQCYIALNGVVMCQIPYGATGLPPDNPVSEGSPIDQPVPDVLPEDMAKEQPEEVEQVVTPMEYQDDPFPGDTTTVEQKTNTYKSGDETHINNIEREVIEISGNEYVKTTTTTTIQKADGTEIKTTDVTYSNTGTETKTTNIDTKQTTTQTKPGTSGSSTQTVTTNPDGSKTTVKTGTGTGTGTGSGTGSGDTDGDGVDEGDNEDKMPGQPSYGGLWEGTGIDSLVNDLKDMPGPTGQGQIEGMNPFDQISGGSCQQVTMAFAGKTYTFPGNEGCVRLEKFRDVMGWAFYALTLMGLMFIATRKPG